jgi:hypothetical protein
MTDTEINALLAQVLDLLAQDEVPSTFDFERALLRLGSSPAEAELLAAISNQRAGAHFAERLVLFPRTLTGDLTRTEAWDRRRDFQTTPCGSVSRTSWNQCARIQENSSAWLRCIVRKWAQSTRLLTRENL